MVKRSGRKNGNDVKRKSVRSFSRRDRPPRWLHVVMSMLAAVAFASPSAAAEGGTGVRAPMPIRLTGRIHPWRVRLLWAFDAMDTVSGGRAHGWKAPALIDLRLTRHQRLRSGLDSYWHVDLIRILGSNPSRDAGDVQTLDNLAAHHAWRLYRGFWQVGDARRHWALRLGWQGYDELFGLVPDGGDLLNSSFGQMPASSQAGLPIWPQTSPGLSGRWQPGAFYMMAGLWSGVPRDPGIPQGWNLPRRGDGSLQALELGLDRHRRYKLALGAWALHRVGSARQAHRGVYALADIALRGAGRARRFDGFVQWGQTQPYQSAIGRYLGAGLRWSTRRHGRVSLGMARALLSSAFRLRHPGSARAETAYELTWRARIGTRLTLQPDLHVQPALAPQAAHAFELGLRVGGGF
jgi:carbohydrate-selective porin OprB